MFFFSDGFSLFLLSIAPAGSRAQPSAWQEAVIHAATVLLPHCPLPPPPWLPSAPITPIIPIPSHHFSRKIAFFQKKSPEYFVGSKKGRTFALAFGKNSGSFDRNRSLTDWNRTGKTRQRGVFRDAAMNTSSVRQSFRPEKGRYESETPSQDRQRQNLPARAAEDTFLQ